MLYPELHNELKRREKATEQAIAAVLTNPHPVQRVRTDDVIRDNVAWLIDVIKEHGWPGRSLVGADGSRYASLIAQLAEDALDLQKACQAALSDAVAAGEASAKDLAYLTDQIRLAEGLPQIYGTKFLPADRGVLRPFPIEDPDTVDLRRAAVGLSPIAEYAAALSARHAELDRRLAERQQLSDGH
jgi:hypothetical protein